MKNEPENELENEQVMMSFDFFLIRPGEALSLGSEDTVVVLGYVMHMAFEQILRIKQLFRMSNNPIRFTIIQTTIFIVS